MAQNAYEYSSAAAQQAPLTQPRYRQRKAIKYKAAVWTKKERGLVIFVAAVVLSLMVGAVFTSMQITKATNSTTAIETKISNTKQNNDDLQNKIQDVTSKSNLDKVAKKYGMTLSDDSVRNINQ
ncbi:cell division protein FtsL [Leuconostoc pseudomesenteroides]|uniref:cell division protein FtsL n=1 Tax=Leuconostoc falkenbergense TaxID=2766470 RepID=UPI000E09CA26|nr:cell division protein FtsL [Leuconostoc falkenbergense]MCT4410445.1 cell division protein FtsL [Leuconostoc falkenbergense]MDV3546837.1 cell division protein FtsL [Leuconostoc falkenbergense]RDG19702.1 cell division protein FtsL [Leuconostoc pseudomesenteroides]VTU66655.1 cell division protein FtsL [Lactobacillus reuteri DSM] [Leuconostoc pseudomesenteroides]